jgi:hypothetical protein
MTGSKWSRWAAAAAMLATLTVGEGSASPEAGVHGRLEELSSHGLDELVPAEMELARELVQEAEGGDPDAARLADLQLGLLDAVLEAHETEIEAARKEKEALEAEADVRVERAAYEFLVEQILASGVADYWSGP